MAIDVSGPLAKISWAKSQTTILAAELDAYLKRNPYAVTDRPASDGEGGKLLIMNVTEPLPATAQVAAGMIIAALRDSLDLLANALAEANGSPDARDVYFPIADSEAAFLDTKGGQKKIRKLSPAHREIIAACKPFKGGNDVLHSLNWLNNKAKHRRLIAVGGASQKFAFGGNGHIRRFVSFGKTAISSGAEVAILDADAGITVGFYMEIAFAESGGAATSPVVPTLIAFATEVERVVRLFL